MQGDCWHRYASWLLRSDCELALPNVCASSCKYKLQLEIGKFAECLDRSLSVVETSAASISLHQQYYVVPSKHGMLLRFPHTADFVVSAESNAVAVRYLLKHRIGESRLRHLLLDHILPRALTLLGEHVLHGALLSVGGHGLAIIGPSGAGKSTLAAALSMRAADLHSDDAFVLRRSAEGFLAQGAYPGLRLWPDSLRKLYPEGRSSTIMSETSSKRCLQTAGPAEDQVPLTAIIILDPTSKQPRSASATPAKACMALVANAFQFDPSDTVAAASSLKFMRGVALDVPAFVVGRPRDYGQLPALCDVVLSILENRGGSIHRENEYHGQHVAL
jgi:hypothetical protein